MGAFVKKNLSAFGMFWWDFLVGDTPELFVGTLVIIGAALGLRHDRVADIVVVPVLTIAFLAASTYRGRKRTATGSRT